MCKNLDDVLRTIEQNLEKQSVIVYRNRSDVIAEQGVKRVAGQQEIGFFTTKLSRISECDDTYNDMD